MKSKNIREEMRVKRAEREGEAVLHSGKAKGVWTKLRGHREKRIACPQAAASQGPAAALKIVKVQGQTDAHHR